jgi:hemerythrin
MAENTWGESQAVGVAEIDAQHQALVVHIGKLFDSVRQNEEELVPTALLTSLFLEVREHFATEERLMTAYDFPEYRRHKAQHDALITWTADLQSSLYDSQTAVTVELLEFIQHWLADHIPDMDKELGAYLNSRGIA